MNTYNELGIKVTKTLDDLSMIVTSNLLSRINTMKVSGMAASEVRKVLVADLIAGGRIFGQLRNGVKSISKNAIEEAGNIAAQKAFVIFPEVIAPAGFKEKLFRLSKCWTV